MNTKIIGALAMLVVPIILIGTVLVPIIGDAVDDTEVVFNSGLSSAPSIEVFENPTGNVTIEYTPGENKVVVNGTNYSTSAYDGNIFWCDKGCIMTSNDSTAVASYHGYILDDDGQHAGTVETTKLTISIVDNDVTVTREGANITYTWNDCDWVAYASPNATHKIISSTITTPYYISNDEDVIGFAYIYTDALGGIDFKGTVVNIHKTGENQNMILNKEKVGGYHDLYKVDNSKDYYLDPAYLTNEDETVISPYFYLVPYEIVTTTVENHSVNLIMLAIPPLVLLAALIVAVRMFIRY